jgi:hypothetical protein
VSRQSLSRSQGNAHAPASTSHCSSPRHSESLPAEHSTHEPASEHAGRAARVQSESLSHSTVHFPGPTSQTGVSPVQRSALLAEHSPHAPSGWQAGRAGSSQSVSRLQPAQVAVLVSQRGVRPLQRPVSAEEHSPHSPEPRQTGSKSEQSLSVLQALVQEPLFSSHEGAVSPHSCWLPSLHWAHLPSGWQAGAPDGQSASERHAVHVSVAPSQTGFTPVQRASLRAEHSPQAPVGRHAGVASSGQSPSLAQPRHAPLCASQVGVKPTQARWFSAEHCTQNPALQTGVASGQSASLAHSVVQKPPAALHSGVAPWHALSSLAEHWRQLPLGWHTPAFGSLQSLDVRQRTHTPDAVSQAGVSPTHSESSTSVHCTQAPVVPQSGASGSLHSPSFWQARHSPSAVSQTGVRPSQSSEFVEEHSPQTLLGWQAGVSPPQSSSLLQP